MKLTTPVSLPSAKLVRLYVRGQRAAHPSANGIALVYGPHGYERSYPLTCAWGDELEIHDQFATCSAKLSTVARILARQ